MALPPTGDQPACAFFCAIHRQSKATRGHRRCLPPDSRRLSLIPVVSNAFDDSEGAAPLAHTAPLRTLASIRPGSFAVVRKLTAAPDINQRLREMGFREDQRIKVIALHSSLLCQVCNSRFGLSAGLADLILVEPA
jgi:Fe2+ transport system protein FeoA